MSRPLPHPDGRATRLLAATLRPEARPMAGILAILGGAMALRLALPLLLGRFADDALAGEPTAALTTLAVAYVAAAVGSAALDLVVVWWSARVSWRAGCASGWRPTPCGSSRHGTAGTAPASSSSASTATSRRWPSSSPAWPCRSPATSPSSSACWWSPR